jgi:hypothetical protein
MLGTNDHAKALALYEPVIEILGGTKLAAYSSEKSTAFARDGNGILSIGVPYDGNPATGGNGTMVALAATDAAMVTHAYTKAIEMGARDEGAPGDRGQGFFGAYFRDFDDNKICIFTLVSD